MTRERGAAQLFFHDVMTSCCLERPILGSIPGSIPWFSPLRSGDFSTPFVGLPFWESAASLDRRAMDTASCRMLFVFCCGAMLPLPMGFSALLPLVGFVNESKISATGASSGTQVGKTDFLQNSTAVAMVPLEQANSQVGAQNQWSDVLTDPDPLTQSLDKTAVTEKSGNKKGSQVTSPQDDKMITCEWVGPNKPQLSPLNDSTWEVHPFLTSASSHWASVIGTLIWAWFQTPTLASYEPFSKVSKWPLKPQIATSKLLFWTTILAFNLDDARVDATCPMCHGYISSCTWSPSNQQCPSIDEPTANRAILAGATGTISLAKSIGARFLRAFTRAELTAVTTIAARPPPGTPVVIAAGTKLKEIGIYLSQGLVSIEQVSLLYAGFIDEESDADMKKELMNNLKLIMSLKDLPGVSGAQADVGEPYGAYTWLLAMMVGFVTSGTIVAKSTLGPASSSASSGAGSRHTAKLLRPKTLLDFFEVMNLYIMFYTSLGFGATALITQFFEFVVFDTIRIRKKEWYVAFELLVVLLRKVEDSVELTIGTVMQEVYLNGAMDEAMEAAKVHFAAFFRTRGGTPQLSLLDLGTTKDNGGAGVKWNGKFNTKPDAKPCFAFNSGIEHDPSKLTSDGTCKFAHVCDHWVSDQGPGGRCLGKKGTAGHARHACDNPHKCDAKAQ